MHFVHYLQNISYFGFKNYGYETDFWPCPRKISQIGHKKRAYQSYIYKVRQSPPIQRGFDAPFEHAKK